MGAILRGAATGVRPLSKANQNHLWRDGESSLLSPTRRRSHRAARNIIEEMAIMTKSINETQAVEVAPPTRVGDYQLTTIEELCFTKLKERSNANAPVPTIKVKKSENVRSISLNHPNRIVGFGLLMNALGTANPDFAEGIKSQLVEISLKDGEINEDNLNFALSVVTGVKPIDQDVTMFRVLMAASYLSALKMAGHLCNAQTLAEQDSAERAFSKCARTFAVLSETLTRKHSGSERSGNEQTVTVQNVSVSDNAQAIVGNVTGSKSKGRRGANPKTK